MTQNRSGKNQYTEVLGHYDHQPQALSTAGRLTIQYKVSPKTIRQDAKVAEGINAIGEVSMAAKNILRRGEHRQKGAGRSLNKPKEEIEALAVDIKHGTYGEKSAVSSAQAKQASDADRMLVELAHLGVSTCYLAGTISIQ